MDVEVTQLHLIREQHSDSPQRLREVLKFWLDGNTCITPSPENITKILRTQLVDEKKLSNQLCAKYDLGE